eukprot:scaffold16438_cov144-Isochrysis_galbana.AAC.2
MTEFRPPRAVSPSWFVILFWPHRGLIGSNPRAAHPAARSAGVTNWARSRSSKCWTVIAMRASTLAATRRLAGFGLEAWRDVTSKWMGGSLSFSDGTSMPWG